MIKTPEAPKNYCIVCNEVARREDLSARAKGIYYYLATLPTDWELQQQEAESHFTEGREAFKTAFKELIQKGYILQAKVTGDKGRLSGWKYTVLWTSKEYPKMQETDTPENRNRKNRQTGNRPPENPQLLNTDTLNTNIPITEELNNKVVPSNQKINNTKEDLTDRPFIHSELLKSDLKEKYFAPEVKLLRTAYNISLENFNIQSADEMFERIYNSMLEKIIKNPVAYIKAAVKTDFTKLRKAV